MKFNRITLTLALLALSTPALATGGKPVDPYWLELLTVLF